MNSRSSKKVFVKVVLMKWKQNVVKKVLLEFLLITKGYIRDILNHIDTVANSLRDILADEV